MNISRVAANSSVRPQALPGKLSRKNRADIQALRALAVVLVVVNHLWGWRLQGGYVGVDVFFVISGFLITTHLLQEFERTDSIRLGRFYARRAKRLLPAALLVALSSLAAAIAFTPVALWRGFAEETFAASAYFENWFLAAKSVDYSAQNAAATTVQHYWSLSVEEQFYLVWPVFILIALALGRRLGIGRRAAGAWAISLITFVTFVVAMWLTSTDRSQAYFVTQTRVWEFSAGALVGLLGLKLVEHPPGSGFKVLLALCQWGGLTLIAFSAISFNDTTAFPGPYALIPVVGTCLVIFAGTASPTLANSIVFRPKPIQIIGDISYSLYLWHWPLIVLAPFVLNHELRPLERVVLLLLSIALAYLTKIFVEDPGRTKLLSRSANWRVLMVVVISVAVVAGATGGVSRWAMSIQTQQAEHIQDLSTSDCFGALSLFSDDCPNPYGPVVGTNAGDSEAPWFDIPECRESESPISVKDRQLLRECDFTNGANDAPRVWLVGDSHAEQWQAAVLVLARTHGWHVSESLLGGCPFVDVKRVAFMNEESTDPDFQQLCLDWGDAVTDRLAQEQPDLIIVSAFGAGETIDDETGRPQLEQYRDAVTARFTEWRESTDATIAVIQDAPLTLGRSTPECVAASPQTPIECANPREDSLVPDPVASAADSMNDESIGVIETSDLFCDEEFCYAAVGGISTYYDADHIARSYVTSTATILDQRMRLFASPSLFSN